MNSSFIFKFVSYNINNNLDKYSWSSIEILILKLIIGLLIITNPSAKDFKEFRGEKSYSGLKREQNWFIFSIYNDGSRKYLGIISNFFKISEISDNGGY